ncbi:MAG: ABC transporter ATP-binding protein/permease [Nannocystaceae bacterium]|nr:ABC transporter ATP-binding protein/permease [Nannocystaceae bacterium]
MSPQAALRSGRVRPVASSTPLRRLFSYARHRRPAIAIATTYSVLNKLFDLAPPMLIGAAVDVVVQQENSFLAGFGVKSVDTQILLLALVTFLIWGLESIFEYAYALAWRNLAQTLQHELRQDAYEHVQRLELAYFEDRSTGGLMTVLGDDVNQLERFLDDGANQIIQLVTTVLAVGALFIAAVPSIAPLAIAPTPLVIAGSLWFQKRLAPRYAAVRARTSDLAAGLANKLTGIATIKAFVAEEAEAEQLQRDSRAYLEANAAAIRLSSAFVPLIRMGIVLGFTATLVLGAKMATSGALSVGLYSVLVFMTQRLLWPLTRLGNILDQYQRAMASTRRVLDLLDTPLGIEDGERRLARTGITGAVDFQKVRFSYAEGPTVLKDIDIQIAPGSTVAFVGPTGSGKSTLIKLLLRFYDPSAGVVCLEGHDVRSLALSDLRRAIGLVSQDVFLFHGTVRENIAYGAPDASSADIERAAKLAEAHEFILQLAEGYDTLVGERGQKLSGGQRQRISLARAILVDPPILVLDEATSAVDNETEAAIQRSLQQVARDRTTMIVAHRLSTIRNADCTYVLEGGRITERGTHDELLRLGGTYAALWSVQTGETSAHGS